MASYVFFRIDSPFLPIDLKRRFENFRSNFFHFERHRENLDLVVIGNNAHMYTAVSLRYDKLHQEFGPGFQLMDCGPPIIGFLTDQDLKSTIGIVDDERHLISYQVSNDFIISDDRLL